MDGLTADMDTLVKPGTGTLVTEVEGTLTSALIGFIETEFGGGAGLDFLATTGDELVVIFLTVMGTIPLFEEGRVTCVFSFPSFLCVAATFSRLVV